jgi:phosphoribosylanthranilate isomerase
LKVCGITRDVDLRCCVDLGVDAIGLNLWPGSRRHVTLERAAALLDGISGGPTRVGVFVDAELDEVDHAIARLGLSLIQPHGDAPQEPYAALAARRGIGWIRVIRGTPDLDRLPSIDPPPAWILLDAAVPGFGGAGQQTNWTWAAQAVRALAPITVWLAGGITPHNAAAAIATVHPAGLDVASGAELPGQVGCKDPQAIAALLATCR